MFPGDGNFSPPFCPQGHSSLVHRDALTPRCGYCVAVITEREMRTDVENSFLGCVAAFTRNAEGKESEAGPQQMHTRVGGPASDVVRSLGICKQKPVSVSLLGFNNISSSVSQFPLSV